MSYTNHVELPTPASKLGYTEEQVKEIAFAAFTVWFQGQTCALDEENRPIYYVGDVAKWVRQCPPFAREPIEVRLEAAK